MSNRTFLLWSVVLSAVPLLAGCRPPATVPAAAPVPAIAPAPPAGGAVAQAPAPHLGGSALPGKAQTRPRELMDRTRAQQQLRNIGIYIHQYKEEFNHYPARLEDFLNYIKTDLRPEHESLQTGYFALNSTPSPTSETVLVYEQDPDLNGMHLVLMGDCNSVQRITEDQFKAAVPAAGK